MKIYSPSQTKLFIECPRKWWVSRKQGWQRRYIRKNDIAAIVGHSVGRVLADHCHIHEPYIEDLVAQVDALFKQELADKQEAGYLVDEQAWVKYDSYLATFPKLITKYFTAPNRIPQDWTIKGVEYDVGDGGTHRAYIDVLGVEPDGSHVIWDFKCKMYLKREDEASTLLAYRQDWQMLHYGYFYWQKTGMLPSRYYIGMPVLTPTPRFVGGYDHQGLGMFSYTEQGLLDWYESACTWWSMMEQCEDAAWAPMSPNHTGRYGNCEYYDACFTFNGNTDTMQSQYIQIDTVR